MLELVRSLNFRVSNDPNDSTIELVEARLDSLV
jgi:hypothetical protein